MFISANFATTFGASLHTTFKMSTIMDNVLLYVVQNDDGNFGVDGNVQAVRDILEEDSDDEQDAAVPHQVDKKVAGKKSETLPKGWNNNYWTRNETLLVNNGQFIAT